MAPQRKYDLAMRRFAEKMIQHGYNNKETATQGRVIFGDDWNISYQVVGYWRASLARKAWEKKLSGGKQEITRLGEKNG